MIKRPEITEINSTSAYMAKWAKQSDPRLQGDLEKPLKRRQMCLCLEFETLPRVESLCVFTRSSLSGGTVTFAPLERA